MSSWDQADTGEKLGLAWRSRKKISQIINNYLYLAFFPLIILCSQYFPSISPSFPSLPRSLPPSLLRSLAPSLYLSFPHFLAPSPSLHLSFPHFLAPSLPGEEIVEGIPYRTVWLRPVIGSFEGLKCAPTLQNFNGTKRLAHKNLYEYERMLYVPFLADSIVMYE
jgi:hypothetical protein